MFVSSMAGDAGGHLNKEPEDLQNERVRNLVVRDDLGRILHEATKSLDERLRVRRKGGAGVIVSLKQEV